MFKYATLVLRNVTRNKRRTILTILSIAVSLFIFSALISLPTVVNQVLSATASSLRIACYNKGGLAYSMPQAYKQRIATLPHVTAATAENWFGGIYDKVSDQFPNLAIDADEIDKVYPDWGLTPKAIAQFKELRTACLVSPSLIKEFHWHVGQQIMLRGTIYPFNVTLNIVGVLGGKAPPNFLVFRRDYLEEARGSPGVVGVFWVRVDRSSSVPIVINELEQAFANSSAEVQAQSESAFFSQFISSYRTLFKMAEILGIIVILTIGLVAANTAAMSIRERRSEIAVMRSMGFPGRVILGMLLCESLIIGLIGGGLGVGAAYVILKVASVGGPGISPLSGIQIPPVVVVEALIIAALIGIFSALVPARAAARRNIVEALRLVA